MTSMDFGLFIVEPGLRGDGGHSEKQELRRTNQVQGCYVDSPLINMHETLKVSAEGHGHLLQGAKQV